LLAGNWVATARSAALPARCTVDAGLVLKLEPMAASWLAAIQIPTSLRRQLLSGAALNAALTLTRKFYEKCRDGLQARSSATHRPAS
jgi:hypothetical protein